MKKVKQIEQEPQVEPKETQPVVVEILGTMPSMVRVFVNGNELTGVTHITTDTLVDSTRVTVTFIPDAVVQNISTPKVQRLIQEMIEKQKEAE